MARPGKHDRQAARARDQLQAALARGRFGDAADALLALPSEQRDSALPALAEGMGRALERAFAERDQAALLGWLTRSEREPRLLSALGEHALAAHFALFSAALRARMWPRAERLWAVLRPSLLQHELYAALDAIVRTQGRPDSDAQRALAQLEVDAARLGYEAPRVRVAHEAPATLDEVEARCLRCFGAEPWPRFRDVIDGWLRGASPEIARALRVLSAELSARELLVRAGAGAAGVGEVARFIAALAAGAGAPSELEPVIALCLRATARGQLEQSAPAKGFEALASVAATALRYEALRELVARIVLGSKLEAAPNATRIELLRLALAADPSPATLITAAIELHAGENGPRTHAGTCPAWLAQAFEAALADPLSLAQALARASDGTGAERARENPCAEPCHALFELMPDQLAVTAFELLWDRVSEAVRVPLAAVCELLVSRMRAKGGSRSVDLADYREILCEMEPQFSLASDREIRAFIKSRAGQQLLREIELHEEPRGGLDPSAQRIARRLASRAAPYDLDMLELGISFAASKAEAASLVRAHLARVPTLRARLHVLRHAVENRAKNASLLIEDLCCDGIVPGVADAAFAMIAAEASGAPRRICNRFARALLEAVEREPAAVHGREVTHAIAVARRRVRPRKPRAKKSAARKRSRTVAEQLDLDASLAKESHHERR